MGVPPPGGETCASRLRSVKDSSQREVAENGDNGERRRRIIRNSQERVLMNDVVS